MTQASGFVGTVGSLQQFTRSSLDTRDSEEYVGTSCHLHKPCLQVGSWDRLLLTGEDLCLKGQLNSALSFGVCGKSILASVN